MVCFRGGLLDLRLDLGNTCLDVLLFTGTVDDRGRFLVDAHPLGTSEHLKRYIFQFDAEFFRNQLTGGQDRDVLEHGLAAIAEAWRLDGGNFQTTTQLVDDERRERLTLNVLGNDQQRLAGLHNCFEYGQKSLQRR